MKSLNASISYCRLSLTATFAATLAILPAVGCRPDIAPAVEVQAEAPISRSAFGSCAKQDRPQPIWNSIVKQAPDVLLLLGDNIYCDTVDEAERKAAYAKLAEIDGFRTLRANCPILATWDDHDYGASDAGAEYEARDASQQTFLDFFGVESDSPRRSQRGVYHAQTFGPKSRRVQIIVLDTRYHRGPLMSKVPDSRKSGYVPSTDTSVTMLGEAQWAWLEKELKKPAEVRLLVSSIQVVAEDHGFEKWANLPHERRRLFEVIKKTGAEGLVILSGDRHFAELSEIDAGIGYPVYDLTSSSLNASRLNVRLPEVNRHRVSVMSRGHNFGMVIIDWGKPDPEIRLQIRDLEGDITIQEKINLSALAFGTWPA
jgi:alkaline phosphatase D